VGWGNVSMQDGTLHATFGYVDGRPPRGPVFARELAAELECLRVFLTGS
jgi:uncharacterized protein